MKAIGIFDSGMGGLAVVKCLNKYLPNESIVYLGDTKRVPYGNKSPRTIKEYGKHNSRFFNHFDLKALGIACNTIDSNAHNIVCKNSKHNVFGLIQASAIAAYNKSKSKHIIVLATKATVKSKAYTKAIKAINPKCKIYEIACIELVNLIETNASNKEIEKYVQECLKSVSNNKVDTIVLGCTHYHFISHIIKKIRKVNIISSAEELAKEIKNSITETNKSNKKDIYYVTDYPEIYEAKIKHLLNVEKVNIKEVDLKDYQ